MYQRPNQVRALLPPIIFSFLFSYFVILVIRNRAAFVRSLVHATLSDANGYVEGLSATVIDDAIDLHRRSHPLQDEEVNIPFLHIFSI